MATETLEQHRECLEKVRSRAKRRRVDLGLSPALYETTALPTTVKTQPSIRQDSSLSEVQNAKRLAYGKAYIPKEETLRSDISQQFINNGSRPQNYLQNCELAERFNEYPKLQRLIDLHSRLVSEHALPPTVLKADFRNPQESLLALQSLHFDSIHIAKPQNMDWDDLLSLPIPSLAASPSFIWIWCGDGTDNGLEKGRELLAKWGFRRCEDIVWLKTNRRRHSVNDNVHPKGLLASTKEHCLMGIKGTVRRSTDGHIAHCNVDTDVIVWEGSDTDPNLKPPEIYSIIENFCLGNRRLDLFPKQARRGWLSVIQTGETVAPVLGSPETTTFPFNADQYKAFFQQENGGVLSVPSTSEIDMLRPRSPPRYGQNNNTHDTGYSGGGIGRNHNRMSNQPHPQNRQQPQMPTPMPPMPMSMQHPIMSMMAPMANPMAMMFSQMGNNGPIDWSAFFGGQNSNQS